MDKSKKSALLLYGVLGIIVVASLLFLLRPAKPGGAVATIQVGNQEILEIELGSYENGTFSIEPQTGLPISFEVKDGAIRFSDSNCPDKVCVNAGFIHRDMDIASCLPNRTVLSVSVTE